LEGSQFQACQGKKVHETPSQWKKAGPDIPEMAGSIKQEDGGPGQSQQKNKTLSQK
jgi:hypothetical protein